jgi:hypothetical protein
MLSSQIRVALLTTAGITMTVVNVEKGDDERGRCCVGWEGEKYVRGVVKF